MANTLGICVRKRDDPNVDMGIAFIDGSIRYREYEPNDPEAVSHAPEVKIGQKVIKSVKKVIKSVKK